MHFKLSCRSIAIPLFLPLALAANGQQEKSAFEQSLERDSGVQSEESWVEIKGKRFRKIEFKNEKYYLVFKNADDDTVELYCMAPEGWESELPVATNSGLFRRSAAFVRAFHDRCQSRHGRGNEKTTIDMDPAIGLQFPNGPGKKSGNRK